MNTLKKILNEINTGLDPDSHESKMLVQKQLDDIYKQLSPLKKIYQELESIMDGGDANDRALAEFLNDSKYSKDIEWKYLLEMNTAIYTILNVIDSENY